MKNAIVLLFIGTCFLPAQDAAGDKVNVVLTDPSRPARIHAHVLIGGIVVRAGNTRGVTVETRAKPLGDNETPGPPPPPGMHRIDVGRADLKVEEQDNLVTVKTTAWALAHNSDLIITVPRRSSLQLKTLNGGDIYIEGVDGEIDADTLNGKITAKNVSGSVVAHALNGPISVTLDQVDATKPMAFSTLNGNIDVTLPDNVRANVRMKTDLGEIYSAFDVKLDPSSPETHTISGQPRSGGLAEVHIDHTLRGTINGGGPQYEFRSLNGQIYIRKK